MATFTETGVGVDVNLRRANGEDRVLITAQSIAPVGGSNMPIRSLEDVDVTLIVPPELLPQVAALLDAAEAYVKTLYEIP